MVVIGKLRRSSSYAISCVVLAGVLMAQVRSSSGRPAMVGYSAESPNVGTQSTPTHDFGDDGVSFGTQTGAFGYTYSFVVPPGRLDLLTETGIENVDLRNIRPSMLNHCARIAERLTAYKLRRTPDDERLTFIFSLTHKPVNPSWTSS